MLTATIILLTLCAIAICACAWFLLDINDTLGRIEGNIDRALYEQKQN